MNLHQSNFQKFYLLIPLLVFFCSSCGHKYYAPNDADLVVLKEKNDVHISGTTDLSSNGKKINHAQLGYSPIKHLGLTSSYFSMNQWENASRESARGDGKIWSASIGTYIVVPFSSVGISKQGSKRREKKIKNQHLFHPSSAMIDLYFGTSRGQVNNFYKNNSVSNLKFKKNYVQIGVHWTLRSVSFDLASRIGNLNYYEATFFGKPSYSLTYINDLLKTKNNFRLLEHSLRAHFGVKHARLIFSVSGISQSSELNQLGVVQAVTTFGLMVDIDEFFRKEK